jgi:hypothetical protein
MKYLFILPGRILSFRAAVNKKFSTSFGPGALQLSLWVVNGRRVVGRTGKCRC